MIRFVRRLALSVGAWFVGVAILVWIISGLYDMLANRSAPSLVLWIGLLAVGTLALSEWTFWWATMIMAQMQTRKKHKGEPQHVAKSAVPFYDPPGPPDGR